MLGGDAVDRGQAEPAALDAALGGEERLEEPTLGEDGGFGVFDPLRGVRPDAKILCVSPRPVAPAELREAATPAVLQKPFTVLHLLGKVRQVLDGRDE